MNTLLYKCPLALLLYFLLFTLPVSAEPYMAIKTGMKCGGCHINQTGGGKRTQFGNIYGQQDMSSLYRVKSTDGTWQDSETPANLWTGVINDYLSIGGNIRSSINAASVQNQDDTSEFSFEEALVYVQLNAIPNRLTFYLDEQVAPGGANNREAFALLWNPQQTLYLKAGRMFLPYGFRIEDDEAFVRQVSGINYTVWDDGIETGLDMGSWNANLAITNGSSGSGETNKDKQISLRGSFVQPSWRVGYSLNVNNNENDSDRTMQNIFLGYKLGFSSWLFEFDHIADDDPVSGEKEQQITYLEGNFEIKKGHNLKFVIEGYEPDLDIDNNNRTRNSIIWELVPIQFTQLRLGYRKLEGIPQSDVQNTDEIFFQMNNYF